MQSQAATIDQFEHLLREIQPEVQTFRDQIVESDPDYLEFFRSYLESSGLIPEENESYLSIDSGTFLGDKPCVILKLGVSKGKTKSDDIVNLITAFGIILLLKSNPEIFPVNLRILIEKISRNSEFVYNTSAGEKAILSIAIDNNPLIAPDFIALKKGNLIPERHNFQLTLQKNTVANRSVDLIAAAAQTITSISQISTRKLDPMHLAHILFQDIRTKPAERGQEVEIKGVINALDESSGNRLKAIMEPTIDAIAKFSDFTYKLQFRKGEPVFQNHPEYSALLEKAATGILGRTKVLNLEFLNKDFFCYSSFFRLFPTVVLHIACLDSPNGTNLIPTLQLAKIGRISQSAIKAIGWTILQF